MFQFDQGHAAMPAPGRPPAPLRRSWRWPVRAIAVSAILAILLSIGFAQPGRGAGELRPLKDQLDNLALLAGLGINQVSLIGHRVTADRDVFDALRLDELRSMARFSIIDARARIAALPWVAEVSIARVFPDELRVAIKERVPFALWRTNDGGHRLIDATGHVLGAVRPDAAPGLPLVIGEGAARRARDFVALVSAHRKIAGAVLAYERIANRRWTLWLAAGPRGQMAIKLPENDPGRALTLLSQLARTTQILDRDLDLIDLRYTNRLILRPAGLAGTRQQPGPPPGQATRS